MSEWLSPWVFWKWKWYLFPTQLSWNFRWLQEFRVPGSGSSSWIPDPFEPTHQIMNIMRASYQGVSVALSNFPSFTPQISRDFWDDLKYPIKKWNLRPFREISDGKFPPIFRDFLLKIWSTRFVYGNFGHFSPHPSKNPGNLKGRKVEGNFEAQTLY